VTREGVGGSMAWVTARSVITFAGRGVDSFAYHRRAVTPMAARHAELEAVGLVPGGSYSGCWAGCCN
jgi:hypothetical protein